MIGYINIVDVSSIDLIKFEAHLFITDFEYDERLYLPSFICNWMPVAGSLFFPYNNEVLHNYTSSYRL